MSLFDIEKEDLYTELFLRPLRKCKDYKPKFGESLNEQGVSLDGFLKMYGADPFYSWIGLDSGLMYAAHKAAGGMTSVYRQIGIGCELIFREVLVDTTQYAARQWAHWSYTAKTSEGKDKTLSLDGRLELNQIANVPLKERLIKWMHEYCNELSIKQFPQNGVVFEVRQGYKSKDSKRQNADIDNATVAWANGYLPIFAIFSSQIDSSIVLRYRNNRCGIMVGSLSEDPGVSIFAFCKNILGYDLADFFKRNSPKIKDEVFSILNALLDAK
ncbi:hypothetical protein HF329_00420 [Chitinophaga oryzae]|uniref:Uncharacterized protein n=1 Tax=Chitinophaga oryzae TaxID=2725414 RepID=A0AAE6ZCV1_9BACT|nr:hypothetical protein [Chitinophaga oryzae]QJB29855.1 hypothetical protein HF329_00420 [Chitinophaga oryzae]